MPTEYPAFISEENRPLWDRVPSHSQGGLARYIENGIVPGGFLTAVLENDLMRALGRADDVNRDALFDIASFLYNAAPVQCHGSRRAVREWSEMGGLNGIRQVEEGRV